MEKVSKGLGFSNFNILKVPDRLEQDSLERKEENSDSGSLVSERKSTKTDYGRSGQAPASRRAMGEVSWLCGNSLLP